LNGVDFAGSDLASFDLEFADLRGTTWKGIASPPKNLSHSLRGSGTDSVRGADYDDIAAISMSAKTWTERFFSFKLIVDNWGENKTTIALLGKIFHSDGSAYMRNCSFLYFVASFARDKESMAYCVDMAANGNAYYNMYRAKKVRRYISDYLDYLGTNIQRSERYPEDISPQEIIFLARTDSEDL